jgi:hypothetical protein
VPLRFTALPASGRATVEQRRSIERRASKNRRQVGGFYVDSNLTIRITVLQRRHH